MAETEAPPARPGILVSFEGGEGAGKSTQIELLRDRLEAAGRKVVATREPGGSELAERIRSIILSGRAKRLGGDGESLLFAAARRDHVRTLIRPALRRGRIVLCDRFVDSTRVYQGALAGVDDAFLAALEAASIGDTRPELTVVIDVAAGTGLERARLRRAARGETADRFEAEDVAYHDRVREAFLAVAAAAPDRCVVVDGAREPADVAASIWAAVSTRLAPDAPP